MKWEHANKLTVLSAARDGVLMQIFRTISFAPQGYHRSDPTERESSIWKRFRQLFGRTILYHTMLANFSRHVPRGGAVIVTTRYTRGRSLWGLTLIALVRAFLFWRWARILSKVKKYHKVWFAKAQLAFRSYYASGSKDEGKLIHGEAGPVSS